MGNKALHSGRKQNERQKGLDEIVPKSNKKSRRKKGGSGPDVPGPVSKKEMIQQESLGLREYLQGR